MDNYSKLTTNRGNRIENKLNEDKTLMKKRKCDVASLTYLTRDSAMKVKST